MTSDLEQKPEDGPSLRHRATAGAVWIFLEMIGVQGTSFAVFATIAHFVSPRDVGLISVCYLVTQSIKMLAIDPTVGAITRKESGSDEEYTTAFWITIFISALSALLIAVAAPLCERLFNAPGLTHVLIAMSIVTVLSGVARTHEEWMMRHFLFRALAVRAVVGAVIGGIVGVVMAITGWGVWALVGQQLVTTIIAATLVWATCPWRPTFTFSWLSARYIFLFLRSIWVNAAVGITSQNCDTFLVAYYFGPASVGVYNVAKRVRLALQLVASNPINGVLTPALAEIQSDHERLRRGLFGALSLICAACGPVFIGAAALSNQAVQLVFGQKWTASGPVLELLSITGLAIVLLLYCENVFITLKRPSWNLYVSITYVVLALLCFMLLGSNPKISLAVPFTLPYLVVVPLANFLVSRLSGITLMDQARAMAPGLGSCLVMFLVIKCADYFLTDFSPFMLIMILCPLGALVYCASLWIFGRSTALLLVELAHKVVKRLK